jgi:hypothetical protein
MTRKAKSDLPSGLFTKQHYEMLISERRKLNDLIGTLDRAEQCGVDCATYRAMRTDIDNQLAAIQQHFMTPAPTS